ncbi:hypothetical protein FOMG_14458 [Fusarium oxysporum f. sp. melonis 26406]|uniref:Uncharacterized protein n=1 Tax=Fusarium oxysporum f. sp. melonis 26406 TaxID=1089452 RepID=X0A7X0_FUSOX|nr:hypothetical protein FOMG_14458 [Fusarium oxysporum f. sp. melonis 26406]
MGVHDEDGERQLSEPPATREELISLLTKAFTALAKGTENPLGTVALRIHTEGRPKHQIQIRSEVEERSTMRTSNPKSQFISRCRHEALCLGWRSTQPDCDWDSPDIAHVLATVTPLNINISTRAFAFRERDDDWREVGDTDWLERVTDWTAPQILSSTSRLCIPSPWHSLPGLPELKGFQFPNWKILQYVSELPNLPRLNRLALRFQLMKESIVLNLLKRTRPGGLFLGTMWLDPGKFKPIFEFCSSLESNMQKLEVRKPIYQMGLEERGQVHFQRQPYDEDAECCAHLRRQGEGFRRPIHFHLDPQGFVEAGTSFCNSLPVNSEFDSSQAHTF